MRNASRTFGFLTRDSSLGELCFTYLEAGRCYLEE